MHFQNRFQSASPQAQALLFIAVVALSVVSIYVQGFGFGISNNVYHIPITLGLIDLPQFADDAFYQSLHGFVSPVWPLLSTFTNEGNIQTVFFVCHLVARILALLSLARLSIALGADALWQVSLLLVFAALSPLLLGATEFGAADLLDNFFSHSELVHPLVLGAFAAVAFRRNIWAYVCAGVAFHINLFVGVWLLSVVSGAVLLQMLFAGQLQGPNFRREIAMPVLLALAIALPTLYWTWQVVSSAAPPPPGFDFRVYLMEYFAQHTLITALTPNGFWALAGKLSCIILGLRIAARNGLWSSSIVQGLAGLATASIALLIVGMFLPMVTASSLILNLHLLRADLLVHWLAIICGPIPVLLLVGRGLVRPAQYATLVAYGLAASIGAWPLQAAAMLVLADCRIGASRLSAAFTVVTALGLAAALVVLGIDSGVELTAKGISYLWAGSALLVAAFYCDSDRFPDLNRICLIGGAGLAAWLFAVSQRGSTLVVSPQFIDANFRPLVAFGGSAILCLTSYITSGLLNSPRALRVITAICLLLVGSQAAARAGIHYINTSRRAAAIASWEDAAAWMRANTPKDAQPVMVPVDVDSAGVFPDFQWLARRPVWVTQAQGAAVMWAPSFYARWRARILEVKALASPAEALLYACRNNIRYVLTVHSDSAVATTAHVLHDNGQFRVLVVDQACSTRTAVVTPGELSIQ
jgi:hypothetical protein